MTTTSTTAVSATAAGESAFVRGGRAARAALARRLGLRARVAALEAEVQEGRMLHRRVAELTDVVAELLVPLELRDSERVEEVLQAYRRSI